MGVAIAGTTRGLAAVAARRRLVVLGLRQSVVMAATGLRSRPLGSMGLLAHPPLSVVVAVVAQIPTPTCLQARGASEAGDPVGILLEALPIQMALQAQLILVVAVVARTIIKRSRTKPEAMAVPAS